MRTWNVALYWLFLLVPTIAIGAFAVTLLRHEGERMEHLQRASLRDRAVAIAETIQITVEAVEVDITEALRAIPREKLLNRLLDWKEVNPLIRNVFTWAPRIGLQHPPAGLSTTSEERGFIARYRSLFSRRLAWDSALDSLSQSEASRPRGQAEVPAAPQSSVERQRGAFLEDMRRLRASARSLQALPSAQSQRRGKEHVEEERADQEKSGWIPWFSENRLYLLGWVTRGPDHVVYGVELELMTLLAQIVNDFPATVPKGTVYALLDDSGRVLHQAGDEALGTGTKPDMTVSLSPSLPHWQVGVFLVGGGPVSAATRSYLILSGLMLAIFVAAIVLGGSLLTWQARKDRLDAQQKTSFVSNVSHELKTPLTSIRMYAELLKEGRIKEETKQRHYLHVIVSEAQRLTRLVNNVLDFSRLEQGRMKYRMADLEITGFLSQMLESHRLRIQEAGMTLTYRFQGDEIVVRTDRDALEQALLNIIDNAIKYASRGGTIKIDGMARNRYVELRFMDRGPGVPPAHQAAIFEKFHRVHDSLTAGQLGSGLGLALARMILRDLGGDLMYEPREGGGSCFVVTIPLREVPGSQHTRKGV